MTSLTALLTVLLGGGGITAFLALYRARPERDAVIVASAQSATAILEELTNQLRKELDTEHALSQHWRQQALSCEQTMQQHDPSYHVKDFEQDTRASH